MKFKIVISLSLAVLLFFLSSCAMFKQIPEYNLLKQDKNSIQKALEGNYTGIKSLYGRAAISFSDAENRNQYNGSIYYKISDSLFIQIDGAVGETEAVVFLRPDSFFVENYYDRFSVQDLREKFTLRRVGGLDIPFEDLEHSLYGYEPISENFILTQLTDEYVVLKNPVAVNRYQEIKINKNMVIEEVKGFSGEELDYIKQYDYFFLEKGHYLPHRIVIRKYNPNEKLTIYYNSLELDRFRSVNFYRQGLK